jgi:hypothetical protein
VVKSRGQHCGDLELAAYLANEAGPVPLVLDLRIAHDRIGSSANPALNGTLTHPNNIDESLNAERISYILFTHSRGIHTLI